MENTERQKKIREGVLTAYNWLEKSGENGTGNLRFRWGWVSVSSSMALFNLFDRWVCVFWWNEKQLRSDEISVLFVRGREGPPIDFHNHKRSNAVGYTLYSLYVCYPICMYGSWTATNYFRTIFKHCSYNKSHENHEKKNSIFKMGAELFFLFYLL